MQAALSGSAVAAKETKEKDKDLTIDSATDALWALVGPMATNLGFSGIIGLIAGIALKVRRRFILIGR